MNARRPSARRARLLAVVVCCALLAPLMLPTARSAAATRALHSAQAPVVGSLLPSGGSLPDLNAARNLHPAPVAAPPSFDHGPSVTQISTHNAAMQQRLLAALLAPYHLGSYLTSGGNIDLLNVLAGQSPADGPDVPAFTLFPWSSFNFAAATLLISAPTNLRAHAEPGAQIKLLWDTATGANSYQIERSPTTNLADFQSVGNTNAPPFMDTGVNTGTATTFLYRVRAVDSNGSLSAYSNRALGTNVPFSDEPLVSSAQDPTNATPIRAQHLVELRRAVNAMRKLAFPAQPPATWQYPDPVSSPPAARRPIYAVDITELRLKVDEALAALSFATPQYQPDPNLSNGENATWIKAAHFQQLRQRVNSHDDAAPAVPSTVSVAALLDPINRTGGGGVDPYSRNYNWSLPLVSLPGRAGLDLGLTLSYNSLVWTKEQNSSYIQFDADRGTPAPGFRFGFPVIQPMAYNTQTGKYAYLLLTPAGQRVELRQVAATNTFAAADSSYLQLTDNSSADGTLALYATDGTRLTFSWKNGQWQCAEIKDRNGNYISVNYTNEQISSVVDTLGRTLTFNYNQNQRLTSITQPWKRQTETGVVDETHTWATFSYETQPLAANAALFNGLTVLGTQGGASVPVLKQVGLADGSYYKFAYTAWAQVWQVTRYSPDSMVNGVAQDTLALTATRYNLPGSNLVAATPQTDCPRFTERRDWVKFGVMNQDAEVVTSYTPWAANLAACDTTLPDGTLERELYATSGWQRGLTTEAQFFSADNLNPYSPKKRTTFAWTQDDINLTYRQNPRVTDTTVSDSAGNNRRTSVSYTAYGLPQDVTEYMADGQTPLRTTHTDYNLSSDYISRRIIGLPSYQSLYEGTAATGTLRAKTGYVYDDPDSNFLQATDGAPSQHDETNYGSAYRLRGQVNRVRRYEVTQTGALTDETAESQVGYNTTGAAIFTKDAAQHLVQIAYADAFYPNVNRAAQGQATFAYPTTVTDPDGFTATSVYNYDLGAVAQTRTPLPNATDNQPGPVQTTLYDEAGRAVRVSNSVNSAYQRLVYWPDGLQVLSYATLVEGAGEFYRNTVYDGAGRVHATAAADPAHQNHFSGQLFDYDEMGRLARSYKPTEVDGGWQATGDDDPNPPQNGTGWVYTGQSYDWKGRPLVTRNVDGTTKELSYGGCGCAGGEVVTSTDEVGRQQRVSHDVLGRVWQSEVLNADGTVYSAATNRYNVLDQVTRARAYQGAAPVPEPETAGTTYQTATMTYDGYGRLWQSQAPVQAGPTEYAYNNDGTTSSVKDARGMTTNFTYNGRHLVTQVSYDQHGLTSVATEKAGGQAGTTEVAAAPAVDYGYDAAGNRISMALVNDAGNSCSYEYDNLSQLTSEARKLPGLSNTYTLSYEYTLAGQVRTVTDVAANKTFTNSYDAAGRLTDVTGTGYGQTATFMTNMQYRAWGAPKSANYGNGTSIALGYDARGLLTHYGLNGTTHDGPYGSVPHGSDYEYYADGQVRYASDLFTDALSSSGSYRLHDRAYEYDHVGRLQTAYSGHEANKFMTGRDTTAEGVEGAYQQNYSYDVWGQTTARTGRFWSADDNDAQSYDLRGRNAAWEYDADGQFISRNEVAPDPAAPYTPLRQQYDAAGRLAQTTQVTSTRYQNAVWMTQTSKGAVYDGDGVGVQQTTTTQINTNPSSTSTTYYLRSSVLGGRVIAELGTVGAWQQSYVYAGGERIAREEPINGGGSISPRLLWTQTNPVTGDALETDGQGWVTGKETLDPQGVNVGDVDPFVVADPGGGGNEEGLSQAAMNARYAQLLLPPTGGGGGSTTCLLDGIQTSCSLVATTLASGAGVIGPANTTRYNYQKGQFEFFRAYADGYQGWGALNAVSNGHGGFTASGRPTLINNHGSISTTRGKARPASTGSNGSNGYNNEDESLLQRSQDALFVKIGGQPQNPTLPNEITDFYRNHQGTIDRCINRIFGQHSDGTPDVAASVMPRQTLRNAPELDTSLTQFQLQGSTQAAHTQGTYGFPGSGGNGTVYIASDVYGRISTDERVRTYFHELGNILSHRITGGNARAFGNPNGIGRSPDKAKRDTDTGARLESCIFGSVPF